MLCLLPFSGAAQDVTLTSRDGTLSVSGELRGYDGELYRVMTEYGLLTLDGQSVICDGPACPDLTQFVAEVRVTGEADDGGAAAARRCWQHLPATAATVARGG